MAEEKPERVDPGTFLRDHVAPRSGRQIEELRAQAARLEAEIEDRLAAEATIQLVLEGEGGGTWYLNLRRGDTTVGDRAEAPPLIRVYQAREDWEALARAQLAAGGRTASPGGDLTRSRIGRLRGIEGALEFRLGTDEGERPLVVQFGSGERSQPRCILRLRADDARRLQAGELSPQVAFLQGLVKLEGDAAFAMQVGAALFL
jgi:hypothetical protein